mmetsp:Transcript_41391/g.123591  ORF Transcript_41391/g.123591 Transcript_41391/m.123591 type:complete len:278 (-) Transcript_41391:2354-3187(-)
MFAASLSSGITSFVFDDGATYAGAVSVPSTSRTGSSCDTERWSLPSSFSSALLAASRGSVNPDCLRDVVPVDERGVHCRPSLRTSWTPEVALALSGTTATSLTNGTCRVGADARLYRCTSASACSDRSSVHSGWLLVVVLLPASEPVSCVIFDVNDAALDVMRPSSASSSEGASGSCQPSSPSEMRRRSSPAESPSMRSSGVALAAQLAAGARCSSRLTSAWLTSESDLMPYSLTRRSRSVRGWTDWWKPEMALYADTSCSGPTSPPCSRVLSSCST